MINKDKKRILITFYNINKNEKTKVFLNKLIDMKSKKRLNENLPNNFTSFRNNPSQLSSINIKNKNNKKKDPISLKANQSISTISYIIKKNNHNDYKNFYTYDYSNKINDLNISTIHSNGKFQNTKKIKINLRDKIFSQSDKNIILKNKFISKKLKKNLSIQVNKEKDILKDKLKDIKISSHYLGNILDNKFGIMTNKFLVNKNILLTSSHSSLKLKKNYNNSIQLEPNYRNTSQKNEFKSINIQNHNNYFNAIGIPKLCPEIKNTINPEKIYINLMNKMSEAFNIKLKEYYIYKLKEKNKSNSPNLIIEKFRKNFMQFKKEKSSYNRYNINFINKAPIYGRNNSFLLNNENKNKTLEEHINKNIYRVIAIKSNKSHKRIINLKSNENKTSELP